MGDGVAPGPMRAASRFQILERGPHGLLNHAQLPRRCVVRTRDQVPPSRRERSAGTDLGESPAAVGHPQRERAGGVDQQSEPGRRIVLPPADEGLLSLVGGRRPDPGLHGEAEEPGERRGIGHHRAGSYVDRLVPARVLAVEGRLDLLLAVEVAVGVVVAADDPDEVGAVALGTVGAHHEAQGLARRHAPGIRVAEYLLHGLDSPVAGRRLIPPLFGRDRKWRNCTLLPARRPSTAAVSASEFPLVRSRMRLMPDPSR